MTSKSSISQRSEFEAGSLYQIREKMAKDYSDYCWRQGKPEGVVRISHIDSNKDRLPMKDRSRSDLPSICEKSGRSKSEGEFFRIVSDPYHKRYTIEKYREGIFQELIYDSSLLDFRKLHPQHQMAWQREILAEREDFQKCLIRDMDERIIFFEELFFTKGRCHNCLISSVHGIFVAEQKVFLREAGDPFDGVILFDRLGKTVMYKKYSLGNEGQFEQLLEECWEPAS